MSNNKRGIELKRIILILSVIVFILISNHFYFDDCLYIRRNDNEIITETKEEDDVSLKGLRNIYFDKNIAITESRMEVLIPHKNENEITDIVFRSIKNVSQLARCKLDKQTYVRYNIA